MNIFIGQHPPVPQGSAVTIGNFDGVHQGHLHILQTLKQQAEQRQLSSTAIIFEPQPTEFFAHQRQTDAPFRITPLRDKLALLQQTGCLKTVWVQRFNPHFANQSAEHFIEHNLLGNLNTRYLLIGDDFRFGKGRGGNFELLQSYPQFITQNTPSVLVSGSRASSTAVRQALSAGDIATAKHILGHDYILSGHVKHGKKLGRKLGCPTANIHLPHHHYALRGVFVVQANGDFGTRFGVASFGTNPTVSQNNIPKLEVHLFDFSGSLYGQRLKIAFLHQLRQEQKFAQITDLQQQILCDMQQAQNWIHQNF